MPGGGLSRVGRAVRRANGSPVRRAALGTCDCCDEEPPRPCCDPPTPCGQVWEVCIEELECTSVEVASQLNHGSSMVGPVIGRLTTTTTQTQVLRGGPYRLTDLTNVTCNVFGTFPVTQTDRKIVNVYEGIPGCDTSPTGSQRSIGYCVPITIPCPQEAMATDTQKPPWLAYPGGVLFPGMFDMSVFGARQVFYGTDAVTGQSLFGVETNTNAWRTGQGTNEYVATRTFSFNGTGRLILNFCTAPNQTPRPEYYEEIVERTITVRIKYRVVQRVDCDGLGTNPRCQSLDFNDCDLLQRYRVATQCGGGSLVPVLVPIENVISCGVFQYDGACWTVSPRSPTTIDASAFDDRVIYDIIDSRWPVKTCCECDPTCPSVPIAVSQCWDGGVRSGVTGEWTPNQPFVAQGDCCCNPDDIITVSECESLWQNVGLTFYRKIIAPVSVRRGQPWIMRTIEEITSTETGEVIQVNEDSFGDEFDPLDPFTCDGGPWGGGVNAQGFGPGNLAVPQKFISLHSTNVPDGGVLDMPCPILPDGTGNGTRVISKNVSVTCTTFAYDGLWEWNGGYLNGGSTVTHKLRISITQSPNGQRPECSGGCDPLGGGGPVAGPERPGGPQGPDSGGATVRSILEGF